MSQGEVAEKLGFSRQFWQRVESGQALLGGEAGRLLEEEMGSLPLTCDALTPQQIRVWTRVRPFELLRVNPEPWQRAGENWGYGISQLQLPKRLPEWLSKLFPADSAPECYAWLQIATLAARPLVENPHFLGFREIPILDRQGRALGERRLPGLYGSFDKVKFIVWPQVSLRPSRAKAIFRVDGLVWVKQGRKGCWGILEFDGSNHDLAKDEVRRNLLKLGELRIPESEITGGQAAESFRRQARKLLLPC